MGIISNTQNDSRICYVDPNDVRGNINGVPVTPDYTEFCIWCNLIVEQSSRLKNQYNGDNGTTLYGIAFDMTSADQGSNFVSFMRGKDAELYNFLTTDYTNIDYQEVKKRNIIEGLQIESVQISFVNYQTPQITIKFVDVRGGSFFAREEATHNEYGHLSNLQSENDKIIDNFYSCFVTFPYPKFRLQVKGFYGKPVTFQLTCTSFVGNFNAQTGNFEIVVQFIGYEYGVLGDIPFDLLVAAPMTKSGREYWDNHVANMANNGWALDKNKTEAPFLLYDFYQKISAESQGMEDESDGIDNVVDESTTDLMKNIKLQTAQLNDIKTAVADFKQKISDTFYNYYITNYVSDEEDVVVVYCPKEEFNVGENFCSGYNNLGHLIANYNAQYGEGGEKINLLDGAGSSMLNNNDFSKWVPTDNIRFDKFIKHTGEGINEIETSLHELRCLTDKEYNEGIRTTSSSNMYKISDGLKNKILQDLSTRNWSIYGGDFGRGIGFANYALVIVIGNTTKEIDNRLTELENKYEVYKNKINSSSDRSIREVAGFSPYVGRYFKNVMCHLETLVFLFNECADTIYGQINEKLREPALLGINMKQETDVPDSVFKQVPPFPAVYKKYTTNEEEREVLNSGKNIVSNTWIGDFKGKWAEKDLVDELYKAAQRIGESRAEMSTSEPPIYEQPGYKSLMPIDYIYKVPSYAYSSKDGAMLYTALRAEVALNFMQGGGTINTNDAEQLGKYDGYIFTKQCDSNAFITSLTDTNKLQDELYDGTVYTDKFKSTEPKQYEFTKVYNERQPVFVESGNYVKYKFMTNDDRTCEYIPLENHGTVKGVNGFAVDYSYENGNDFTPKDLNSGKYLIGLNINYTPAGYYGEYKNTHHFDIITDKTKVETIKKAYNEFKNGEIKVGGKSSKNMLKTVDKHVLVGDDRLNEFYDKVNKGGFISYKALNFDIENIGKYSKTKQETNNTLQKFFNKVKDKYKQASAGTANTNKTNVSNSFVSQDVGYNYEQNFGVKSLRTQVSQANYVNNPVEYKPTTSVLSVPVDENDYYIHLNKIYEVNNSGSTYIYNLFGHRIYYLQNQIQDEFIRNACKTLLFLHTIPFSYKNLSVKLNSFFNDKSGKNKGLGGIETVPYGYLLFLGGLMWRKEYMENNNTDPIKYKQNTTEFVKPQDYRPLFIKSADGELVFGCSTTGNYYTVTYKEIISNTNQLIEMKLIDLFTEFVKNEYPKIINYCDLRRVFNDNPTDNDRLDNSNLSVIIQKLQECNTVSEILEYLRGEKEMDGMRIQNFDTSYALGFTINGKLALYYKEESKIQEIYKDLQLREVVAATIPTPTNNKGIDKSALKSYFIGFTRALQGKIEENKKENEVTNTKEERNSERDFKCELYLSLKNIWDRWLCGYYNQTDDSNGLSGKHMFEVKNFFTKNFVFIDSFYSNIYDTLRLNCSKILKEYTGNVTNNSHLGKNVTNHLGSVVGAHNCMMFNFPDNVNFAESDETGQEEDMVKTMKEMFTPMAANKVMPPEYHNKFTIIYTHPANKLDTVDRNKFTPDTFDIWSYNDGTGVAPEQFNTPCAGPGTNQEKYLNTNRMGYKVPAFGVAYSRQNNSFWRNISIGMENYSVTQQSIMAEAQIAERGNSDKNNITFYGQDIYNLYQSYSYLVTIEMMGNAQIQPLMYFQLMNIPMFRGSYMIIKVEHNITPGHMTTTFTGMKMSKVQPPYTTAWFEIPYDEKYDAPDSDMDASNDDKDVMTSMEGDRIDLVDNNLSKAINNRLGEEMLCDEFVYEVYNELSPNTNKKTKQKLIVSNSIDPMFIELSKSKDWKVNKFKVSPRKNNDWLSIFRGSTTPKVGDLLFGYHDDKLYGGYAHVAIYLGLHGGHTYLAEGLSVKGEKVNNTDKKVHITRMEDSRFGYDSDIISHFAHCIGYEVKQTELAKDYVGVAQKSNKDNSKGSIVVDTSKLKHFTLTSLNKHGSTLNKETQQCLTNLIQYILDPLYEDVQTNRLGSITITSGYRNQEVNSSAGGSKTSQHMEGKAADLSVGSYTNNFKVAKLLVDRNYEFDQLIIEAVDEGKLRNNKLEPRWIHVSFNKGSNRKQISYTIFDYIDSKGNIHTKGFKVINSLSPYN